MDEYIQRQDAIDAIKSVPTGNWSGKRYAGEIEKIPLADVKPVVRGHWTNVRVSITGNSSADCSRCGATVHTSFSQRINFCPHCGSYNGADMRGGGEDEID